MYFRKNTIAQNTTETRKDNHPMVDSAEHEESEQTMKKKGGFGTHYLPEHRAPAKEHGRRGKRRIFLSLIVLTFF